MNYKIALSTATLLAAGLAGCTAQDHRRSNVDRSREAIQSGTTSAATNSNTTVTASKPIVPAPEAGVNTTTATTTASKNTHNPKRHRHAAHHMKNYKGAETTTPASGTTSPDVYHSNMPVNSGTTSDSDYHVKKPAKVSYSRTPNPGGIAPQDRNLRFGLVGNGTGMGFEDTTSKFMTDNGTLADPLVKNPNLATPGALSAPTNDEDQLKDIKSGTTFDYYDIHD